MAPRRRNSGDPTGREPSPPAPARDSHKSGRRKSSIGDDSPNTQRPSVPVLFTSTNSPQNDRLRRSSTYSAYNIISEANRTFQEEIVHPGPPGRLSASTWKSWLPVVFAALPPFAGLFFEKGAAFCNDIILLGLASVLLHWSTTAPWEWYYSAQQVRCDQDSALEKALDISGDRDGSEPESPKGTSLSPAEKYERARLSEGARRRLRNLEVMALIACFLAPAAATYFLYIARDFLSWPSEGLFSNFNLGIVLLATEIGPLSHSIRLVLAHTLHLQRIVNTNPYKMVRLTPSRYDALLSRVSDLEARVLAQSDDEGGRKGCQCDSSQWQREAVDQLREDITEDVYAKIDPDIYAVIRAVRRYERKSMMFTRETEQQMAKLDQRLDDAISLTAVVARNSAERGSIASQLARGWWWVVTFPLAAFVWMIGLFFSPLVSPANWLAHRARQLITRGDVQGLARPVRVRGPARHRRIGSSPRAASRPSAGV